MCQEYIRLMIVDRQASYTLVSLLLLTESSLLATPIAICVCFTHKFLDSFTKVSCVC